MRRLIQPCKENERRSPNRSAFLWGVFAILLALIFSNFIVANLQAQSNATAAGFAPQARVMLFTPDTGHWKSAALQAAAILEEWDRLKPAFVGQDAEGLWADIRRLILRCIDEPHTYLKFIGD